MFRFTIRDVLWLTVVVALGVGWCIEWRSAAHLQESKREEVAALSLELKHRDFLLDFYDNEWREKLEQLVFPPSIAIPDNVD